MGNVPNFLDVPRTAAENTPVEIPFCGKTHFFKEPKKRSAYALLGQALKVTARSGAAYEGREIDFLSQGLLQTGGMLEQTPAMLDFVYTALSLSPDERKQAEDAFEFQELLAAFQTIVEVLQRPFVGGRTNSVQETENGGALNEWRMYDRLMQRWGLSWRELERWTYSQLFCLYAAIEENESAHRPQGGGLNASEFLRRIGNGHSSG